MKRSWMIRATTVGANLMALYCILLLSSRRAENLSLKSFPVPETVSIGPIPYNCSKINFTARRFAMALHYYEQMTMATNNLFSMVNVARGWDALTVVPFTATSHLYGLPGPPRKEMDAFFDINQINAEWLCEKYELPPLAPF